MSPPRPSGDRGKRRPSGDRGKGRPSGPPSGPKGSGPRSAPKGKSVSPKGKSVSPRPKTTPSRPGAPGRRTGAGKRPGAGSGAGSGAGQGRGGASRRDPGQFTPPKERGLGGTQVEGRHAVRELLLAGTRRTYEVILNAEVDRSEIVGDIIDLAAELRVPVTEVSRTRLDSIARTDAPQGVVARAAEVPEVSLSSLVDPAELTASGNGPPFLLALDGVTDPGNLGALLRIGECAGVSGVVLPKHRAVHVTPTVTKAAAGAVEYLPMALVGGLPTAIEEMKRAGVWVVGLDMDGSTSIHDLPVSTESVCLVLGAEGRGLSRLVRQRCDLVASIPLHGRLASLNVASAGAIASYEIARRRSGTSNPPGHEGESAGRTGG
ncbi:MAG: 23S rRNA (guanosine(2251)-2'-O)-methyltransferase RlmB [Acidimicrobiales bacterium]